MLSTANHVDDRAEAFVGHCPMTTANAWLTSKFFSYSLLQFPASGSTLVLSTTNTGTIGLWPL